MGTQQDKNAQLSIGTRLRSAIEYLGMNQKEFCQAYDIPYRTLQNYLSGDREAKAGQLISICAQSGINANWLLLGEGPIVRSEYADWLQVAEPSPHITEADDGLLAIVIETLGRFARQERFKSIGFFNLKPDEFATLAVVLYNARAKAMREKFGDRKPTDDELEQYLAADAEMMLRYLKRMREQEPLGLKSTMPTIRKD
ncbi:helix-turn-helix domain-containing protein [Thalassospira marina]|nr:helix-turn-helix transcriptional regulator [Thalassospira marina]